MRWLILLVATFCAAFWYFDPFGPAEDEVPTALSPEEQEIFAFISSAMVNEAQARTDISVSLAVTRRNSTLPTGSLGYGFTSNSHGTRYLYEVLPTSSCRRDGVFRDCLFVYEEVAATLLDRPGDSACEEVWTSVSNRPPSVPLFACSSAKTLNLGQMRISGSGPDLKMEHWHSRCQVREIVQGGVTCQGKTIATMFSDGAPKEDWFVAVGN